jgi:hypothetical protein
MAQRSRNLPPHYDQLPEQIQPPVLDSIMVYPRSHGVLHVPGEYNTDRRPPRHDCMVTAAGDYGYEVEAAQLGDENRYRQQYKVWNHRDSPVFAQIIQLRDEN